jgi:hypothetical protein
MTKASKIANDPKALREIAEKVIEAAKRGLIIDARSHK